MTTIERLRGGLIVSCQAYPGEPMRHSETMAQIAASAAGGGATGIRAQGIDDIRLVRERTGLQLPLIGLWKDGSDDVFITPTLRHAIAVAEAGADIVALDGTRRERPDGLSLAETIARLRDAANALVMADCGSVDDGLAAADAGADVVGTTLCGYTGERPRRHGPDLEVLAELSSRLEVPVIAEGRIHSFQDAVACCDAGAFAVCVGTAITHPASITRWFAEALSEVNR
ncbi:N-acetylmannosamine-6-phosphate 2-epimerase [Paramicrobacterium chengjingii]|uniref:Putative N-acetylmannosamine-6-phosphate 2-epimerase n=1 Tax=Paramicrobacterium chengjingii TaxID=2769067 RepID=A0ABX6YI40_9MICO|nr:N-acetylmannosamine-6-phosphate 2-epimerase [Microbacterium chengjingii]QPZ38448.1 N-acetylmannosamine-6-phosphate 2-epimerase [Microbacterium chengjingii]